MRKYSSSEERASENQRTTVCHFGYREKVYGLPCTVRTLLSWKRRNRNTNVGMSFLLRRAIAVETRRRRAAAASLSDVTVVTSI